MSINVATLNTHLIGNVEDIATILEELEFCDIEYHKAKHEIRCSRAEGHNSSSVRLDVNTLSYICFSTNERGNIYTAVMSRLDISFPEALRWVAKKLHLSNAEMYRKIRLPFGGFYKNIKKNTEDTETALPTYDNSILDNYQGKYNMMFFQDGIDFKTQEKFNVGYDLLSNRITVPQWSVNGELVGVMGRLNEDDCDKARRWIPLLPCSRSHTLYGFHYNYQEIQRKRACILFESEKSVMQMHSMGSDIALATCGSHLSATQSHIAKSLMVPRIILAFDEGLDEEYIRESAKKLVSDNPLYSNEVGYIYDDEGLILKKGEKQSPSDVGKDKLKYLLREKVRWI